MTVALICPLLSEDTANISESKTCEKKNGGPHHTAPKNANTSQIGAIAAADARCHTDATGDDAPSALIFNDNNFVVAKGFKDGTWSKWAYKSDAEKQGLDWNYRQPFSYELAEETDYEKRQTNLDVARTIATLLRQKEISFKVWFTGNKSYHIISEWHELSAMDETTRTMYKTELARWSTNEAIFKDLDKSNLKVKRLIGGENKPHRRTGVLKTLVAEHNAGENKIPVEVHTAVKEGLKEKPIISRDNKNAFSPMHCLFLDYACKNELPNGNRHMQVVPNLMAIYPHRVKEFADAQGGGLQTITTWKGTGFCCKQLQDYARQESVNKWADTCRFCPTRRIQDDFRIEISD